MNRRLVADAATHHGVAIQRDGFLQRPAKIAEGRRDVQRAIRDREDIHDRCFANACGAFASLY